jgi:hypothetical protein
MPTTETISTERINRKKRTGQFAKGTSGNPAGRPPGSRNRSTLLMETLLEGEAEQLTQKAIEMPKAGDINALRLCLERLMAPRRERPIHLRLPAAQSAQEISAALATITTAIGEGQITPTDGEVLAKILAMQASVLRQEDVERRLKLVEQRLAGEKASDEQPESTHEDLT